MISHMQGFMLISVLFVSGSASSQPFSSFEVVSVKRAASHSPDGFSVTMKVDPEMLIYTNVTLRDVVTRAFDLRSEQIAGPAWIKSELYDIRAKLPRETPNFKYTAALQTVLKERFNFQSHWEKRSMDIFALRVAKGGVKIPKTENDGGVRVSTNSSGQQITGSATMKRLAEMIFHATGRPVYDMTELSGLYSIKLMWQPDRARAGTEQRPNLVDEESGAPVISVALREQLGLTLVPTKAPIDFLVIDHAESAPTGN